MRRLANFLPSIGTVKLGKTDKNKYFNTLDIDQMHTTNSEVFFSGHIAEL